MSLNRVTTLQKLEKLALKKKSVVSSHHGRIPAAFVFSMPAIVVMRWIHLGLYEYKKGETLPCPKS